MLNICSVSEHCGYYYLICQMVYTKDVQEYQEAENQITLFGIPYYKSSWNSEKETIIYRNH